MGSKIQGGRAAGTDATTRVDIFTQDEVRRAQSMSVDEIEEKIISKIIPRIDQVTGQENNARYMAYRLHYIASTYHG